MMDMYLDPQRQAIATTPGLFLISPSANRKFVMGEKSRIGNSTTMYIMAAIFFLIAGAIAYYFGGGVLRADEAARSGKTTRAEITDAYSSRSNKGGTSYYIDYEFKAGGQTYKKHVQIGSGLYNNTYIGDSVSIKYLPTDPNVSVLTGDYKDDTERNNGIILMAIFLPTCLIIGALILWVDGSNRRISGGQLLAGQIISSQGRAGSKGTYNVTIEYGFTNPYGQQLTKKQTSNRPDLRKSPLPAAGTPVAVLYVDDKFYRLM
jgi:hypothetical protein